MDWFTLVKRYFDRGYYDAGHVAVFVAAGKITPEQYQAITGMEYQGSAE